MATPTMWKKVAVSVQSAAAAAVTINTISKAATAVVGYTGTDPVNGDYVLISSLGMPQIDGRVVRVANVNAGSNTFEAEGINSSGYDTFVSGTFQVLTLGITMTTALSVSASGGDFAMERATTIHDDREKMIPGVASAAVYNIDHIWDPSDAALAALAMASDNQAQLAMLFGFANGRKIAFTGYVGCNLIPGGDAPGLVKTPSVITMFGRPTTYAS